MKKIIEKAEAFLELGGFKKDIAFLVFSGLSLIISLFDLLPLPFDAAWVAIILCGVPIIMEAIIGLITAFDIKADVLVSLALIASVCIGEDFAAGEVAFIMQLGALLEDLTVAKARAGIEKLVHLTPQTARVLLDGTETIVPAEQVKVGDVIRVLPGETVAVDGVILSGGQLHPAYDPAGAVCRRGKGKDRRACRPMGHMDRRYRSFCGRAYLGVHR